MVGVETAWTGGAVTLTDERYEYWKSRTYERLMYWRDALRLTDWRMDIDWATEGGRHGDTSNYMMISSSWRYQNIALTVFVNCLETINPSDLHLDEMVVHELLHAHLNEMRAHNDDMDNLAAQNDHEERVVTILSRVIANQHHEAAAALKDAESEYVERMLDAGKTIHKLRRKVKKLKAAA